MRYNLYSVRDTVAGMYNNILMEINDDVVLRNVRFAAEASDSPSIGDLVLYRVGSYDLETGEIFDCPPQLVCRLVDFQSNKE